MRELVGGKRFDVKITATGTGWDLKVAPEVTAKDPKDYKIVGTSVPRMDLPPKFTGELLIRRMFACRECCMGAWCARRP